MMLRLLTLLNRDRCRNWLTPALEKRYGGPLGFPAPSAERPYVVINFVKTLDGFVSFQLPGCEYAQYISNRSQEDAFIMGLLRAVSDAVLEGTTNIVGFPQHTLLPARVASAQAGQFALLRQRLKKNANPLHVFLTRSGQVLATPPLTNVSQIPIMFRAPDLQAVVITTDAGAERIAREFRGFEAFRPKIFSTGRELNIARALCHLRRQHGVKLLVVEGGPRLCGSIVQPRLYDEWFLTTAPQVIGDAASSHRPTLVQGVAFTPQTALWHRLISLKVAGNMVFERYRVAMKGVPIKVFNPLGR